MTIDPGDTVLIYYTLQDAYGGAHFQGGADWGNTREFNQSGVTFGAIVSVPQSGRSTDGGVTMSFSNHGGRTDFVFLAATYKNIASSSIRNPFFSQLFSGNFITTTPYVASFQNAVLIPLWWGNSNFGFYNVHWNMLPPASLVTQSMNYGRSGELSIAQQLIPDSNPVQFSMTSTQGSLAAYSLIELIPVH